MSTLTATQLQQQYIAYFGRPGDPAGIKYWLSSSSGISSAREFADKIYAQDEYKTSTVGTKSTEAQVNQLYLNLFGREADPSGLIYWTGQIEAGTLQLSNVAYDLIWAANNPVAANTSQATADALALTNKTAAATAFTADIEASTSAILAYQPESTSPWKSGSAFDSAVTFITGITTTAHSSSGVDSAVSSVITANTTAGSTVASTTSKFTTSQDVLTGGAGDDIFNGVVVKQGDTGTTVAPGDQVDGGAGTDTLNVSFSGAHTADYSLEAVDTDKVEKVLVSNYETSTTYGTTVSGSLFDSSLTTVGLSSSSASGDTTFTGLTKKVGAEMRNGAADLTITYDSSVLSGTSDVQDLTVSAATGGTFGAAGAETIAIATELAKSKLTNISSTGLKTLKVTGDQALEITTALATKTIDASGSTGAVTLTLGSANQTVTGGSGADVIDGNTVVTKDDTIKGGSGSDTIKLSIGDATYDGETDDELFNVSEFETVDVGSTHDNATLELDTLWSGITTLKAAANQKLVTFGNGTNNNGTNATIDITLNGTTYTSAATDFSGNAAADIVSTAGVVATVLNAVDGFTAVSDGTSVVTVTATTGEAVELSYTTQSQQTASIAAYSDVSFVDAAGTETLDIYSADKVVYTQKDASGSSDVVNVNLKVLTADKGFNQTVGDIDISNTETLNLNATGLDSDYTQTLSNISADATLTTLNITGSNTLTITNVSSDNTGLTTIDASAYTGDLTFSDAVAANQTITTGSGNDSVAFGANLTENDVVDLGGNTALSDGTAGKDTVTATGNLGTSVDDSVLQLTNVETFQLATGGAAATYIDASKLVNTNNLAFSATSGTVKVKNLPADATIGIGITADELTATVDVALADETGTADSITFDVADSLDAAQTITLKSTGIETLNIKASKEASNAETTTFTFGDNAPASIVVTDGHSGDTLALGTLNKTTTSVDAGAYKGITTATGATGIAMTITAIATVNNDITTSTGDDTFTLKGDLGATDNNVDGGTGTDVLNVTLSATDTDFTLVDGFETLNLTIKDSTTAGFDHATEDAGLNDAAVATINILGGNALSEFEMTTATIDDASTDQTIDASSFVGFVELNLASDAFDSTLTIKGGASTKDQVSTIIAGTDNKIASMTGIEKLVVTGTEADVDASIDLSNVTGLTEVTATYLDSSDGDQIEIDKLPAGVTVKAKFTGDAANATGIDILDIGAADASSTTTAVTVQVDAALTATDDEVNIDAAGVETFTLYNKSGAATNVFDLAGVSATTDSKTKIIVTGVGATLKGLSSTVDTVDASAATGAVTIAAADRPDTAMTITTSTGDDSIAMDNKNDVIDSGTGADTLVVTGNGVLGGFAVDLASTTDQVTSYGGVANAAVQKGFEHVDLSAVTGSYGVDVTGSDENNTITTNGQNSNVDGGKGDDTIIGGAGVDTLTGGAGGDTITPNAGLDTVILGGGTDVDIVVFATTSDGGAANTDSVGNTITGFVSASDKITLSGAIATALDDITDNTALAFVTTGINDGSTDDAVAATLTGTNEMLFLNKANSGLTAANLSDISVVATALEAQITLTAANTVDGLIVVESSDVTGKFGVYHYLENNTTANQFDANELSVLAIVTGDAVVAGDFITS